MAPTDIIAAAVLFSRKPRIAPPHLEVMKNPAGEGELVFAPAMSRDVRKIAAWLVLDDKAYPLSAEASKLTPDLIWLYEASPDMWKRSGLNPYDTTPILGSIWRRLQRRWLSATETRPAP